MFIPFSIHDEYPRFSWNNHAGTREPPWTSTRGSYGKPGSVIGSVGVIYNKEQVGGAFAKGTVECLCLNKASLSNFSASVIDVLRRAAFKAILHSLPRNPLDPEPWRILSEQQVNMLISRTEDGTFESGEIVFAPDDGAQLIIVVTGEVAVTKHRVKTRVDGDLVFVDEPQDVRQYADKIIPSGHCYGKQPEFLEGVDMTSYGIAMGRVRLHRILHSSVQELLGDSLMEVMRCAEIKRVLSDIFLFKNLNEATAQAEAEARAKQERENIDVRLRAFRTEQAERRKTALESIETFFSSMSAGAEALYDDRAKTATLIGGLTLLAGGVYGARATTRVAARVLERQLSRPPLVRETSRWSWRPQLSLLPKRTASSLFESIVLEENLAERLQWSTNALLNAQQNGTPFRHLLLHGPPGTGKTLFARTLARQSGLDYAVMSGGDLGPLGREGPHELHKLFGWAQSSRRGLVLFIDEADAFLRRGRAGTGAMSEDARNALSVFLHHTGTENTHVAVILATNVPSVLDRAVLDRIDEAFEFPRPAYEQRLQMLKLFVDQYLYRKGQKNRAIIEVDPALDDKFLEDVAQRTDGMSGRQLAKLVLAFQSAVFGSGTTRLTQGLAQTVLQWRLSHPNAE